jgi:hypothetical protein
MLDVRTGEGAMSEGWLGVAILCVVVLIVAGIIIRAMLSSEQPPGWLAFIARRRAEGRPTRWRKWDDEED